MTKKLRHHTAKSGQKFKQQHWSIRLEHKLLLPEPHGTLMCRALNDHLSYRSIITFANSSWIYSIYSYKPQWFVRVNKASNLIEIKHPLILIFHRNAKKQPAYGLENNPVTLRLLQRWCLLDPKRNSSQPSRKEQTRNRGQLTINRASRIDRLKRTSRLRSIPSRSSHRRCKR